MCCCAKLLAYSVVKGTLLMSRSGHNMRAGEHDLVTIWVACKE
jgi:hypothetical protein